MLLLVNLIFQPKNDAKKIEKKNNRNKKIKIYYKKSINCDDVTGTNCINDSSNNGNKMA